MAGSQYQQSGKSSGKYGEIRQTQQLSDCFFLLSSDTSCPLAFRLQGGAGEASYAPQQLGFGSETKSSYGKVHHPASSLLPLQLLCVSMSMTISLYAGHQGPYQPQPIDSTPKGRLVVLLCELSSKCTNILYVYIHIFVLLLLTTETAGLSFEPAPADLLYSSESPYGTSILLRKNKITDGLEPGFVISLPLSTSVNGELPTPVAAATVEGEQTSQYGQYGAAEGTSACLSAASILMCCETVLDLQKTWAT